MLHPWNGGTPGWEITLVAIRISFLNALLVGLAFLIRSFRACSSEERLLTYQEARCVQMRRDRW